MLNIIQRKKFEDELRGVLAWEDVSTVMEIFNEIQNTPLTRFIHFLHQKETPFNYTTSTHSGFVYRNLPMSIELMSIIKCVDEEMTFEAIYDKLCEGVRMAPRFVLRGIKNNDFTVVLFEITDNVEKNTYDVRCTTQCFFDYTEPKETK